MPEVGSIVAGKYRVVRQIGAGGMGTVVAAEHVALGTPIALKFLSEKIKDSSSSVERFTREARACAQLRSEHVCRVSDFGVDGGAPYIAMELLEGTDLSRVVERGRLDIATATDYVLQACVGLAEAHAAGIVHRDLKPHNLFLSYRPDGSPLVKVLDFGIAKIPVADSHALTRTAHVVGSPGYMAPEQLRSSKTVDTRADVWALGVILYELVSARHPFRAEAVTEIALKIAMDEPPPLTEAPALEPVVAKCLAKEPDERFQDVGALAAALAPFSTGNAATAAVVSRILGDPSDHRRTTQHLASSPSRDAETVREMPTPRAKLPDTTQQHGTGMLAPKPAPRRRTTLFAAIGGIVVAGGIAAAVVASTGAAEVAPDAPSVSANAPAPPAPPPAPIADAPSPVAVEPAPAVVDPPPAGPAVPPPKRRPSPAPIAGPGSSVKTDLLTPGQVSIRGGAGQEIDAIRVQARAAHSQMVKRGLLPSDLGPAAGDEDAITGALARGDAATAKMAVDRLTQTIPTIKIDRGFIQAKLQRVNTAMHAVKLTADQTKRFEARLADVMSKFNDGDFAAANRTLNVMFATLRKPTTANPDANDLVEPGTFQNKPDPIADAKEKERQKRAADLQLVSKVLLDRITNPYSAPVDISTACFALVNSDRSKMPWDRCVIAQCKVNPSSAATLIALAPLGQHESLRALCRP